MLRKNLEDTDTIYDEVCKLEPGNYMTVSFEGEILSISQYWSLDLKPKKIKDLPAQ